MHLEEGGVRSEVSAVEAGRLATARYLIHAPQVSDGYTAWERKRLDLTVEATTLNNPRWHPLFTNSIR